MKKFNWITVFLLNVVTCGIYSMYVWHTMSKNNNDIAEKNNIAKNQSFIVALLLGFVTCSIYSLIWMYLFQKQQVELANARGVKLAPDSSPLVLFILLFIPIYSFYVLCDNYNKTVEAYEAEA